MDNNVQRLHRALVDAIRDTNGGPIDGPVTVSEIYQKFLPYRAARAAVGFEMNADYEYALLRLLAGEGNLARLEPREIQESLRMELDSPNPNVSLFREYANCDVYLMPTGDDDDDQPGLEAALRNGSRFVPEFVDDADEDEVELAFEPEEDDDEDPVPAHIIPLAAQPAAHQCAFCGGDLPAGRLINFCPHCGNDLTRRPCATCGEILEPMWRFCISCGASANTFDSEAN